jgi:zinc finger SWIM domain-containing protein 3
MDYACFGDALSFDTTFQTNKFEMPFAPLLGTNHHKQTILFGAALLYDESTDSFVWLFNTFLTAMSGKRPVSIFTDQCAAIGKAIEKVFPDTMHFLCLWHIYQNAAKHLSHVISSHPRFLADFKKVVYLENSVAHFEQKWKELLIAYDLVDNSWIQTLFGLREKWAAVYRNGSFSADMTSTQRSEGMNNVFKKQFRRRLCLSEFLVEYEKCAASLRENELDADFKSRKTKPVPCVRNLPMLKTAAESYTRRLYSDFEEQFKQQLAVTCELVSTVGTVKTYKVKPVAFEDEALVIFNSEDVTISCSCRRYESKGMQSSFNIFLVYKILPYPTFYDAT